MPAANQPTYLLASPDPVLLTALEPLLCAKGMKVEVVLTAQAALEALRVAQPPAMALLDVQLPGMEMEQFLVQACSTAKEHKFPIVSILDNVSEDWLSRLRAGIVDDVLPRSAEAGYWLLRIEMALRAHRKAREMEALWERAAENAERDPLTGVYNREKMLSMLFRETDRAQRTKSPLCLALFDIDDFGHWNSRLGSEACDELLRQTVARVRRLLRSYDLLGRPGKDEFLVALPGCPKVNAVLFAERLRLEVFSAPFHVDGEAIRLSACFGIAASLGRSPVVVLREAEEALKWARDFGPESIQCFGDEAVPAPAPVIYLSPSSGEDVVAW